MYIICDMMILNTPTEYIDATLVRAIRTCRKMKLLKWPKTSDRGTRDQDKFCILRKHAHVIYRDFLSVKIENFSRIILIFLIYLLKTYIVGTR